MLSYTKFCFFTFAVVFVEKSWSQEMEDGTEVYGDEGIEIHREIEIESEAEVELAEDSESEAELEDHQSEEDSNTIWHVAQEPIYLPERIRIEKMSRLFPFMDGDRDGALSMPEITEFFFRVQREQAIMMTPSYVEDIESAEEGKFTLQELSPEMAQTEKSGDPEIDTMAELELVKFNAADRNKDGFLDAKELPFFYHPEASPHVLTLTTAANRKFLDTDGDGNLTKSEFHGEDGVSEHKVHFAHLDKDGNGNLNATELKPYISGQFHIDKAFKELFHLADADGDKKLTKDELLDVAHHRLEAHDHLQSWADHYELGTEL
mmetsp:Transcript_11858/g.22164  ORF Transcript_11858/g.22164 Transcript_11858/m.22164 type:complete len:320 (+) Transcript_11858:80-1039(+)